MSKRTKLLGFTGSWAFYGLMVWLIVTWTEPRKAAAALAIAGSAAWFLAITLLFFGGRRTP